MRSFYKITIILCLSSFHAFGQVIPEVAKNQCISLDKPVYSSNVALNWSNPAYLSDRTDNTVFEVISPVTLSLQVDAQTSTADSLILHWRAKSWENRDNNSASLKHFEIYTSVNSTDGLNGDWTFIVEDSSNYKDSFIFFPNNQPKWVRVVALGSDTLKLARLEVFQSAPEGKQNDIWFFYGDSETLGSMGAGDTNYLAETRFGDQIHENNPCYYPMVINGGKGGEKATEAVNELEQIFNDMPQISFVACAYGVNDVIFTVPPLVPYDSPLNDAGTETFLNAYQDILNICIAHDALPIPARIPWVHFPNDYSSYVDTTVNKTNGMTPINVNEMDGFIQEFAPYAIDTSTGIPYGDFDTWFWEHRDEDEVYQEDLVHFFRKGINQFNKIWVHTAEQIIFTNNTCDTTGELIITCPENIYVDLLDTISQVSVVWDSPLASTTCSLGESVLLTQVSGSPMGTTLGVGNYYITYEASNYCDEKEICRFSITVRPPDRSFDCGEIDGFTKVGELDHHGYYLSGYVTSWKSARDSATALGGYLVTISSQDENDLLHAALNQETAYIGMYDFLEEGYPEWANGEPISMDLSFDNSLENDYGLMNFWSGTWGLVNQWINKKFIVEMACEVLDLEMSCPSDLVIQLPVGQVDTVLVWVEPTAMTVCDTNSNILLTQVSGVSNGSLLTAGSYEYSYSAMDSCGNFASCSWSVQIDEEPIQGELSLICPDAIEIILPAGQLDTLLTWSEPNYSTTCNVSLEMVLSQISGPMSGDIIPIGASLVEFALMDSCGNLDTCSMAIIVEMTPIMGDLSLSCTGEIEIELPIGQSDTLLTWPAPDYSTTCNVSSGVSLTQIAGPISGDAVSLGSYLVMYELADSCSNIDTCSFGIEVTQEPDAVSDFNEPKRQLVFPNPVQTNLVIELGNAREEVEIKIFSLNGDVVFWRKQIETGQHLQVDVSGFVNGVYFVQVNGIRQNYWARFIKI